MKSSLRSLLFLSLALFGLIAQGMVLPDVAAARVTMAGSVDCAAMTSARQSDTDENKGNCGLAECLAMVVAGCAAVTLPGAQFVTTPTPRAMSTYFAAIVQAPLDIDPFPEIKPPIL